MKWRVRRSSHWDFLRKLVMLNHKEELDGEDGKGEVQL